MKQLKQNIFAVINYMEPLPNECGRKWRSHQIAKILSEEGFDTTFLTSSFSHFYGYQRSLKDKIIGSYKVKFCFAISYSRNSVLKRILSQIIFSISLFIKILYLKPKIILASYPHSFSLISLVLLKIILKFKLIIDIRDCIKQPSINLMSKIYNLMEKSLSYIWVLNADILIGPGEEVYKYLPHRLKKQARKKYRNIPMTYESEDNNKIDLRKKYNFIFIGSLSKAFELENFLKYFKINSKLNLYILGDGPMLKTYKLKYSGFKNIKFLGQVSYNEISNFASKSYFGLMPYSDKDNRFAYHMTNKLGEYLSFGVLPLIPNHCFEMAKFVSRYSCGKIYNKKNLVEFLDNLTCKNIDYSYRDLKSIHQKYLSYEYLTLLVKNLTYYGS